jgi:hypothetical protein
LQIGGTPEKEQDQVYVRFAARGFVYTLPKKIEEILNATPADLRDRHLVRIDENSLDRITIDAPGKGKTVLARKDQNWTIANANNQPANSSEVTRLLNTLENEQVTRFVEDVASDLPKYGLDQPQVQLTFSSFASENTAETQAGEQPFATIASEKSRVRKCSRVSARNRSSWRCAARSSIRSWPIRCNGRRSRFSNSNPKRCIASPPRQAARR